MDIKKIYDYPEALVSDDLINGGDDAINAALPEFKAGAIIYTAGYKKAKQKSLTGSWVNISTNAGSGSGTDTSDATATADDIIKGKSAYVNGQKIEGSIFDEGKIEYEVSDTDVGNGLVLDSVGIISEITSLRCSYDMKRRTAFGKGARISYYVSFEKLAEVIGLTADKIKSGETILGITGTYTGEA